MAGGDNGDGIFPVGSAHGTHGFFIANLLRDLQVTAGLPIGNSEQRVPDLLLKFGAVKIQRQRKYFSCSRKIFTQLLGGCDQQREVIRGGILRVDLEGRSDDPSAADHALYAHAILASVAAGACGLAFFDAFAFPQTAG